MELSIVIPAYREAHKIANDIAAASDFLTTANISGEIIIADDGSPDLTAQRARQTPSAVPVNVLELPHRGKGHAVRQGILATQGQFVMFADSGVCVPFEDALLGLAKLKNSECDIANGSRKLNASIVSRRQSFQRRLLSRLFKRVAFFFLGLPDHLTDTQCGFKVYRGDVARELYAACQTDGFLFDLEVLIRAYQKGYRVAEFPVRWSWDPDSRLRPARILWRSLRELLHIKKVMLKERWSKT
jgi:dolichyl-phosphate beta-glucosyltransferase